MEATGMDIIEQLIKLQQIDRKRDRCQKKLDQVPVKLVLSYGFDGRTIVEDAYTLMADTTPPTVSIVSPADGSGIPVGEATSILISVFDLYGIDL